MGYGAQACSMIHPNNESLLNIHDKQAYFITKNILQEHVNFLKNLKQENSVLLKKLVSWAYEKKMLCLNWKHDESYFIEHGIITAISPSLHLAIICLVEKNGLEISELDTNLRTYNFMICSKPTTAEA